MTFIHESVRWCIRFVSAWTWTSISYWYFLTISQVECTQTEPTRTKKKKRDAGQTFSPSFSLSTSLDSSFLSLFFYFSPFRFAFDWLSDRLSVGVRSYSSIRLYAAWNTSSLSYPSPVCYLTLWRDSEGEVEGSSSARCEKKTAIGTSFCCLLFITILFLHDVH